MLASFQFDGRRPVSDDVLNIIDNTGIMVSANFSSILALNKSCSGDLLMFKPLSFLSMVAASKLITSLLSGKVFSSISAYFLLR